jgi:hypothetical protein
MKEHTPSADDPVAVRKSPTLIWLVLRLPVNEISKN